MSFKILFFFVLISSSAFANYSISKLRDNIYRFQNKAHFSIFIVGEKNVFLTDPLGSDAAKWLRKEISNKFGKKNIQYVFYSHNHWDHIAGGEEFQDENTTYISHFKARDEMVRQDAPTKIPNLTFKEQMTIYFEGLEIQFLYFGRNNGRGNSAMFIPSKKFLFAVDWVLLKRLPWVEMYYYDIDGSIDSLNEVLKLDFNLVSPGHSVIGSKNDLIEYKGYLTGLREKVLKGMRSGKSLKDLQENITMPAYKDYAKYNEWLKANIKGVFDQMERASGRYGQEK